MTRSLTAVLLFAALGAVWRPLPLVAQAPEAARPTLVVLTDIGGDPDDMQSMRRLMLYANEFRIAGLIASASGIAGELDRAVTRPDLIHGIVDDYARVRGNLARHAAGYPAADELRAVIRSGSPNRGVAHLGSPTEGSRHIAAVVDSAAGPVYVAVWGGAHDLAQALWDVRARRSPAEVEAFVSKLRVYAIGDQDAPRRQGVESPGEGTGEWIRRQFPRLRYLQAGPPGAPSLAALFRGMYQNDSAGGEHPTLPLVLDGAAALNQVPWLERHVVARGALGAGYPLVGQNPRTERNVRGVKEGDTPSWFFVLPNGLSDPEQPTWGGWGGRFEPAGDSHFFDAEDEHWSGASDPALRRKWTVARWRRAYQNDFAARAGWSVLPFREANHNPRVVLNGDSTRAVLRLTARSGDPVTLSAAGSTDPDGDSLSYRWYRYGEADEYEGDVALRQAGSATSTLVAPTVGRPQTVHVVLEVTDHGEPRLTGYRRAVITVLP